MNTSIPASVPTALRPLFEGNAPGAQITYQLSDPLFQAIREYHGNLKSVGRYTKLLLQWDTDKKDGELSPPSVVTAKANMVSEVLACYNRKRPNNSAALQEQIADLKEQLRRKDLALAAMVKRAEVAEAALLAQVKA